MIERGAASESEVILAFLKAEADSPRFGPVMLPLVARLGFSRNRLIDEADLNDERQNATRRGILQWYRGFGKNDLMFRGFPDDVVWRRVEVEPHDHGHLKYGNTRPWVELSDGTRSVMRLAQKAARGEIPPDPADHIFSIQAALRKGKRFPELIAAEHEENVMILVEGYCRATAYVGLEWKENIPTFLARSSSMREWRFY
jgi:hypothetical protein